MANTHVRRGRGGFGSGGGGYRGGGGNGSRGGGYGHGNGGRGGSFSSGPPRDSAPRDVEDAGNNAGVSEAGYRDDFGESAADKLEEIKQIDKMDAQMGFGKYTDGPERLGWLVNMHPVGRKEVAPSFTDLGLTLDKLPDPVRQTTVTDKDGSNSRAALDLYFLEDTGSRFKSTVIYEPYFLLCCKVGWVGLA